VGAGKKNRPDCQQRQLGKGDAAGSGRGREGRNRTGRGTLNISVKGGGFLPGALKKSDARAETATF